MWALMKLYLGKLANVAGYPALVRECEYRSPALDAVVKVKKLELFTVVTVNGLDVYFHRLTGAIDGVGANQGACCTLREAPESARSGALPGASDSSARTRSTEAWSGQHKRSSRS